VLHKGRGAPEDFGFQKELTVFVGFPQPEGKGMPLCEPLSGNPIVGRNGHTQRLKAPRLHLPFMPRNFRRSAFCSFNPFCDSG